MRKSPKYSPEVVDRAVRMVFDAKDQNGTSSALGTPELLSARLSTLTRG